MNKQWLLLMCTLAQELDEAGIAYSFEASSALLIQGLQTPEMDDVDLSVQWGDLERAHALFAAFQPSPVQHYDGWAKFQVNHDGLPVDVLAYQGTVMAVDSDRLQVTVEGRALWCKSLAFFRRNSPEGHPRRKLIEAFLAERR